MLAAISIGIDPYIHLGPVTLAWHGLTIALGVLIGGVVAAAEARRRGLDPEPITTLGLLAVFGALVGARVFYLLEHGGLDDAGQWFSGRGFTFYGGFIAATVAIALYVWRRRLDLEYVDAIAPGFALGYAIGRVGDIINGEHYGPATDFVLGVRNTHPDADVPRHDVAYHNGGLYETLIGLTVFAIAWSLRRRLSQPTALASVVVGLLACGRFLVFFTRSDSAGAALGLETAQWVSLVLALVALGWSCWVARRGGRPRPAAGRRRR